MPSPEATETSKPKAYEVALDRIMSADSLSVSDPDVSIHHANLLDFSTADSSVTFRIGDPRAITALRGALGALIDLDSAEGTVTVAAIGYQDGAREYVLTVRP